MDQRQSLQSDDADSDSDDSGHFEGHPQDDDNNSNPVRETTEEDPEEVDEPPVIEIRLGRNDDDALVLDLDWQGERRNDENIFFENRGGNRESDSNALLLRRHAALDSYTPGYYRETRTRSSGGDNQDRRSVKRKATDTLERGEPSSSTTLLTCPVCRDSMVEKQIVATECGHLTCEACMRTILSGRYGRACPKCRGSIRNNTVRYVYL